MLTDRRRPATTGTSVRAHTLTLAYASGRIVGDGGVHVSATGERLVELLERCTRQAIRALMATPLRPLFLRLLRAGVRHRPRARVMTAPAAYAGDVLAEEGGLLRAQLLTGSTICVTARDSMHRHIYFYGVYEAATTKFLWSIARPGWTFLDVGANVGYYSFLALDLGGPRSTVHAFEPNPAMAGLMAMSNGARRNARVEVTTAACGDRVGQAQLCLSPEPGNTGLSSLRSGSSSEPGVALPVDVVTLDEHVADHGLVPDVVKIDVEGYELAVLLGAERLLKDQVPRWVICEVGPDLTPARAVVSTMDQHGYVAHSLAPDGSLCHGYTDDFQNLVFSATERSP